jgi:hypothetical protein
VWSRRNWPAFLRCLLPPTSPWWSIQWAPLEHHSVPTIFVAAASQRSHLHVFYWFNNMSYSAVLDGEPIMNSV